MNIPGGIRDIILTTVDEQFADASIASVNVKPGKDSDGEPILRIHVVFEAKDDNEILDAGKMASFTRHLIGALAKIDVSDFPLVTFVSKRDSAKLNFEVA